MNEYDLNNIFRKKFLSKGLKSLLKQITKADLEISIALMTGYQYEMTKEDFINYFIDNYELLLDNALQAFHSEIFDYLYKIIDNGGELEFKDIDPSYVIILKMYCIAFPVIKDGIKTLIISNEILDYFFSINRNDIKKQIKLNDLVIKYTRGLLSQYGAYEVTMIFDYIKEYEDMDLNIEDFFLLLNNDSLLYGYDFNNNIVFNYQIEEINNFFETRKKYIDLDYYHLNKNQILKGFELTELEIDLLNFFENNLDMTQTFALQGLHIIKDAIHLEMPLEEIKKMIKKLYVNGYQLKKLEILIEKLYSNSRLWSLKGHTRNEINIPKMIRFPKSN